MNRDDIILATLAATNREFSPVQIQKALFLLDKEAAAWTGGPHFNFRAYDYGPFDQSIYNSLLSLSSRGAVAITGDPTSKQRGYALSPEGLVQGLKVLEQQKPQIREYIINVANFVQSLGFSQLVSSIYSAYPEMKVNSVFRG